MDLITCIYLHYTSLDRSQVLQLLHVATVCYTVGGGLHARLTLLSGQCHGAYHESATNLK